MTHAVGMRRTLVSGGSIPRRRADIREVRSEATDLANAKPKARDVEAIVRERIRERNIDDPPAAEGEKP